jgi:hypothetical protein
MTARESSSSLVLPSRGIAPPPLTWRSWPLREPTISGALAVLIVGAGLIAAIVASTGRWDWALLACGAAATCAWRMFVPVTFEVSAMGVTQHVLGLQRRTPWHTIALAEFRHDGVLLVPTGRTTPGLRGLYLPWGGHREELQALCRYYLRS